jgi:holo-[acyl-carrier protein] synthase
MPDMFSGLEMNNTSKLKEIIAAFLKVDKETVDHDTVIDRSAIKGSIMIHRMYAAITKELNYEIAGYDTIRTFGDLIIKLGGATGNASAEPGAPGLLVDRSAAKKNPNFSIGIDVEAINSMPAAADFRDDDFYRQNFSQKEISYCLQQPDPLQSFAGKFAAKEAIVKADNAYRRVSFSQIEIGNDADGAPYFLDFVLSISHSDVLAIAVAAKLSLTSGKAQA